jgi:hypothetical protein
MVYSFSGGDNMRQTGLYNRSAEVKLTMKSILDRISDPKTDEIGTLIAIDNASSTLRRLEATIGGLNGGFMDERNEFHARIRKLIEVGRNENVQIALMNLLEDNGGESELQKLSDEIKELAKSANISV